MAAASLVLSCLETAPFLSFSFFLASLDSLSKHFFLYIQAVTSLWHGFVAHLHEFEETLYRTNSLPIVVCLAVKCKEDLFLSFFFFIVFFLVLCWREREATESVAFLSCVCSCDYATQVDTSVSASAGWLFFAYKLFGAFCLLIAPVISLPCPVYV